MNVLVTGATGYIGGRLVPRLLAGGHACAAWPAIRSRLAGRPWPGVEVVAGDVLDPASLDRALAGMDAAYYLIHSLAAGERGFEERDRRAAGELRRRRGRAPACARSSTSAASASAAGRCRGTCAAARRRARRSARRACR